MAVDAWLAAPAEGPALSVTLTRELPALGARGSAQQERGIDSFTTFMTEITSGPAMRYAGVEPLTIDNAVMLVGGIAEAVDRAVREGRPTESVGRTIKMVIKRVIGPRP